MTTIHVDFAQQVGQNIKELRTSKGVSRQELAEILNVAYSTVGIWETGKAFPRSSAIEKLSEFFDVTKESIIGESNGELPKPVNRPYIDLNEIYKDDPKDRRGDEETLVIYKNIVLTKHQRKQLDIILKGLFLNDDD